jgi:hypothetical protein
MRSRDTSYWFPAKRYGWGWGLPRRWQGWAVLGVFVVLLALGSAWLLPTFGSAVYVLYALVLGAALVSVCYWKGEPPKWRWGR